MSTDDNAPLGRFGDFELLRYFTAGGMADLYLARSPRFGARQLVLKRIQARYLDHTRVVKMFIDEGRIARLLEHPNIVRVLDVGQAEGNWYIAMEHIHGHDLVALGRRAAEAGIRIPRAVAVGALAQVAAGLDYAHSHSDERGRPLRIVHCDVSPGNVVISFRGVAKIVDFGIARADLFPLGVMLHELTVGKRLFRGPPPAVMRMVCDDPIPAPSELVPGYPRALERIVMRLLERDPSRRYPTAGAALADLREYLLAEEQGWDSPQLARFLRSLFAAPRQEASDPSVIVEDVEVDRGMPETDEVALPPVGAEGLEGLEGLDGLDDDHDTPLDTALPPDPRAPGHDGPTVASRLPPPAPPPPRPPVEATELMVLPPPPRRERPAVGSALLVAASVAMLAVALVVAWLIAGR